MQTTNEMLTDISRMLTGQVQPMESRVWLTMLDPADGSQAVALDQHRHSLQQARPL
jgi:hypothetical protein